MFLICLIAFMKESRTCKRMIPIDKLYIVLIATWCQQHLRNFWWIQIVLVTAWKKYIADIDFTTFWTIFFVLCIFVSLGCFISNALLNCVFLSFSQTWNATSQYLISFLYVQNNSNNLSFFSAIAFVCFLRFKFTKISDETQKAICLFTWKSIWKVIIIVGVKKNEWKRIVSCKNNVDTKETVVSLM